MRLWGLILLAVFMPFVAMAREIVCVVNDVPISDYDVSIRAKLNQIMSGKPVSEPNETERKTTLEQLIDEQLRAQTALKAGLSVTPAELNEGVVRLESQRGLKTGTLKNQMRQNAIPVRTLEKQMEADLLWFQYLSQNKQLMTPLTDKEVKMRLDTIERKVKEPMYLVAELQVADREDVDVIFETVQQGADFGKMAEAYSTLPTKSQGGYTGWISADKYESNVRDVLKKMNVNQMSKPIRVSNGWMLVLLLDKRLPSTKAQLWEVAQVALPLDTERSTEADLKRMRTCEAFLSTGKSKAVPGSVNRGFVNRDELPGAYLNVLKNAPLHMVVGPVKTPDGNLYFMKCSEKEQSLIPSKDELKQQMEMEQMVLLTERLLRDARRFAVIEYK